jgi:hypothetical protein
MNPVTRIDFFRPPDRPTGGGTVYMRPSDDAGSESQQDEGSLRSQASGELPGLVFNALWTTFENEGGRLAPGTTERMTDAVLAVVTPELERLRFLYRSAVERAENLAGTVHELQQKLIESRRASVSESVPATPRIFVGAHSLKETCRFCVSGATSSDTATDRYHFADPPPEATSEASQLQANSKLEQNLEYATPPSAGGADTTPRVWMDRDGDHWREEPDGLLSLVWFKGLGTPCEGGPTPRERVEQYAGPLVEVLPNTEQETEK